MIKDEFQKFIQVWNSHTIRGQANRTYLPTGEPINIYYGVEERHLHHAVEDGVNQRRRFAERSTPPADYAVPIDQAEVLSMLAPLDEIDIDSCLTPDTRMWCNAQLDDLGWTGTLGPEEDRAQPFKPFYLAMRERIHIHVQTAAAPRLEITTRHAGGYRRFVSIMKSDIKSQLLMYNRKQ